MHSFKLKQDGMVVAAVEGGDFDRCLHEMFHYASQYAKDGDFTMTYRRKKEKKVSNPPVPLDN